MWRVNMKYKLILLFILVAIVLMGAPMVSAKSSYLSSFNQHYNTGDTRLNTCDLCHSGSNGGSLNPYGRAYSNTMSFTGIEGQDSDGDGFTNLEEINALTFPGDPTDYPVIETVATVNTTPEVIESVVTESVVNDTTNISAQDNAETTGTTTSDQQSPGFESIIAVFTILAALYLGKK